MEETLLDGPHTVLAAGFRAIAATRPVIVMGWMHSMKETTANKLQALSGVLLIGLSCGIPTDHGTWTALHWLTRARTFCVLGQNNNVWAVQMWAVAFIGGLTLLTSGMCRSRWRWCVKLSTAGIVLPVVAWKLTGYVLPIGYWALLVLPAVWYVPMGMGSDCCQRGTPDPDNDPGAAVPTWRYRAAVITAVTIATGLMWFR